MLLPSGLDTALSFKHRRVVCRWKLSVSLFFLTLIIEKKNLYQPSIRYHSKLYLTQQFDKWYLQNLFGCVLCSLSAVYVHWQGIFRTGNMLYEKQRLAIFYIYDLCYFAGQNIGILIIITIILISIQLNLHKTFHVKNRTKKIHGVREGQLFASPISTSKPLKYSEDYECV